MELDRRAFLASVGGLAVIEAMDPEARAEALEHYMMEKLDEDAAALLVYLVLARRGGPVGSVTLDQLFAD